MKAVNIYDYYDEFDALCDGGAEKEDGEVS